MKLKLCGSIILLSTLVGCAASRPVLYDNAKYQKDPAKAEAAVKECLQRAEKAKSGGSLDKALEKGVKGGAASAAAGGAAALAGGGRYNVGRSAGMSAAGGFAGNAALGLMDSSPDPAFAKYVELCLSEKGYRTISWK